MSLIETMSGRISEIHDKGGIIHSDSQEIISSQVFDILSIAKKCDRQVALALTWGPWAWKWWALKALAKYMAIKLRRKNWDPNEFLLWDIHAPTQTHVLYVMLDAFFKEIWVKRRSEMLQSMENFIEMFSDDGKAISFMRQYLESSNEFEFDKPVYLKTDEERQANAALSRFKVIWKDTSKGSLMLIDWVNAFQLTDDLVSQMQNIALDVIKMMVYPRLEMAFQRIIRRDHVGSKTKTWKPIKDIVKFRLKEPFYLFSKFTLPAINQEWIYMIDFTPHTDHKLTKSEILEVIRSLEECRDELWNENYWDEFNAYLVDYVDLLLVHFKYMISYKKYFFGVDRVIEVA